jgi:hypothetical protein
VRGVQDVAGENLPGNQKGQSNDGPGKKPAGEGAYFVYEEQQFLHDGIFGMGCRKWPPGWGRAAMRGNAA